MQLFHLAAEHSGSVCPNEINKIAITTTIFI